MPPEPGPEIDASRPPFTGLEAAGGIAAPLLAGIAFAMIALVLQLPATELRWRDPALALLVVSGLSMIATVQAAMWARQYANTDFGHGWATFTVRSYDAGILFLLAAVTVVLIPAGAFAHISWGRRLAVLIAGLGLIGEIIWVIYAVGIDLRGRWRMRKVNKMLAARTDGVAASDAGTGQ